MPDVALQQRAVQQFAGYRQLADQLVARTDGCRPRKSSVSPFGLAVSVDKPILNSGQPLLSHAERVRGPISNSSAPARQRAGTMQRMGPPRPGSLLIHPRGGQMQQAGEAVSS